ncbi:DUF397 domain-containing protein [Microbispora sp. NBC_01389]|uniref:DUF397 domain-containing protein n=1 Tax=Microbispora sp. NBC_01389 TaxID=2903584 RepID=UPI003255E50B
MDLPPRYLLEWQKSSYSGSGDNCVEVAVLAGGGRAVRDSKDPDGPVLTFTSAEWRAFIGGVKHGAFD